MMSRTGVATKRSGFRSILALTTTVLLFSLVTMILAGCADMKPLEYRATDQIKPGPGLFTGEEGEFVLYGSDRKSVLD